MVVQIPAPLGRFPMMVVLEAMLLLLPLPLPLRDWSRTYGCCASRREEPTGKTGSPINRPRHARRPASHCPVRRLLRGAAQAGDVRRALYP